MGEEILPLILDTIKTAGDDRVGRTAIQKILYFLNEIESLDIRYKAYYYGPFSQEVYEGTDILRTYGYLNERVNDRDNGVDYRSYTYSLTEDGKHFLNTELDPFNDALSRIIKAYMEILDDNLKYLSYAAKYHYIEKNLSKGDLVKERRDIIDKYGWEIPSGSVDSIISFINEIGVELK